MKKYISLFVILVTLFSHKVFSQDWNVIRVGSDSSSSARWNSTFGKAEVVKDKKKYVISVFYKTEPNSGFKFEYFSEPQLVIEATVGRNGKVSAVGLPTGTDEGPIKLKGTYKMVQSTQSLGGSLKVVTREEIIFPYPENYTFYGFKREYVE